MTTNRVYLVENLTVDEKFLSYFSDGEVLLDNHTEEIMVCLFGKGCVSGE